MLFLAPVIVLGLAAIKLNHMQGGGQNMSAEQAEEQEHQRQYGKHVVRRYQRFRPEVCAFRR